MFRPYDICCFLQASTSVSLVQQEEQVRYDDAQVWRSTMRSTADIYAITSFRDDGCVLIGGKVVPGDVQDAEMLRYNSGCKRVEKYEEFLPLLLKNSFSLVAECNSILHVIQIGERKESPHIQALDISIWKITDDSADFLVHKHHRRTMEEAMNAVGIEYFVLIPNVQKRIDATSAKDMLWTNSSLRLGHRLNFKTYPSLEVIEEYYKYLRTNFPTIVTLSSIGSSIEYRPLMMIQISNGKPNNKRILLTGGQHAREWISIITVLYIVNEIVTKYNYQPKYVQDIDWYIVPLVNPDGYQHSQTRDRLWRKNRRPIELVERTHQCYGVDTNRNFDKSFNKTYDECNEEYSGTHPFSEPETIAIKDLFKSMGSKIPSLIVDFHSYGQFLIHPWAYDKVPTSNLDEMMPTLILMQSTIRNATGRRYRYGIPMQLVHYTANGVAIDWFHSEGVILSIVVEARDKGSQGFLLEPAEIEGTSYELWEAVKAITQNLHRRRT